MPHELTERLQGKLLTPCEMSLNDNSKERKTKVMPNELSSSTSKRDIHRRKILVGSELWTV